MDAAAVALLLLLLLVLYIYIQRLRLHACISTATSASSFSSSSSLQEGGYIHLLFIHITASTSLARSLARLLECAAAALLLLFLLLLPLLLIHPSSVVLLACYWNEKRIEEKRERRDAAAIVGLSPVHNTADIRPLKLPCCCSSSTSCCCFCCCCTKNALACVNNALYKLCDAQEAAAATVFHSHLAAGVHCFSGITVSIPHGYWVAEQQQQQTGVNYSPSNCCAAEN